MTTMSDECERTCPLCAEEMDLTDQQLKPCRCGYEICVWCWHHIIDMAEKDDTEGRCPACRIPYDKEKIVGAAANCERMVAEVNSERKIKSQKAKPKASEGRKHLSSVRVIQRNLVYVIGIPANLADEDTLEKREYFGQYGKVLKVSITRPSGGGQNSSSNSAVSVYITYTKEDEAVRCIQSVHGFTLDGRSLRACFGTTKYCHTWLRNMPCNNPDCLYLHEVGVQEDSFTKDEIISAYTRSRVQQITGVANNHFQRRAGTVLPPPADDFCSSSSASVKPNVKNSSSNNSAPQVKVSPPNSSSGRSSVLPPAASWGLRGSNCRPPTASSSCTQGSTKQISDSITSTISPSKIPITAPLSTLHSDANQESTETDRVSVPVYSTGRSDLLEFYEHSIDTESQFTGNSSIDASVDTGSTTVTLYGNSLTTPNEQDRGMSTVQEIGLSIDQLGRDHQNFASNHISPQQLGNPSTGFQQYHCDNGFHATEAVSYPLVRDNAMPESELCSREISSWDFDSHTTVLPVASMHDNDGLFAGHSSCLSHSSSQYVQSNKIGSRTYPDDMDSGIASGKIDETLSSFPNTGSIFANGYKEHNFNTVSDLGKIFGPSGSNSLVNAEREKNVEKVEAGASEIDQNVESSIISSILSLDLDSWDDPLTSSSNFAKMFGESDRQSGSIGLPSSWKQNSESRFSFARQEDLINQTNHLDFAVNVNRAPRETRNFVADKHQNGFITSGYEDFGGHFNSQSISSSKAPAPRAQMSAPPGFSVPNRPPPGFSSQERLYRAFDSTSSGNPLLESSLSRNHYQVGSMGSVGDVELIDPAILAVGKGRLPLGISNSSMDLSTHFPATRNSNDGDLRLRLLLQQQSLSAHQNYRISDQMDDGYTNIKDRFITSRLLGQTEENNLSHFSQMSLQSRNQHFPSGQWDSWNEVQNGNEMNGVAEFLRNERVGLNKFYSGYDELKVRMPSSTELYNRAFGI